MAKDNSDDDNSYALPPKDKGVIMPDHSEIHEPDTKSELSEVAHLDKPRSTHQQFMYELSISGRSLAEIQRDWHKYYSDLGDAQKHQVWQEFYEANSRATKRGDNDAWQIPAPQTRAVDLTPAKPHHQAKEKAKAQLKRITKKDHHAPVVRKKQAKSIFKPLVFGLSMGALTIVVLLFGFFNERFLAPLITPSRNVSSTPIIVDPNATATTANDQRVIIPKINVEVPVVYNEPSIEEKALQHALESGVVHYATTSKPGEQGNAVIFGHSSNNILNKGKYKFAFVLLSRLDVNDTFILTYGSKRYVYKVTDKRIVKPEDFSVLTSAGSTPKATLITCDPPGTSLNRLVVVGEQVTPDPSTAVASSASSSKDSAKVLPGNAPSLWDRIKDLFTS